MPSESATIAIDIAVRELVQYIPNDSRLMMFLYLQNDIESARDDLPYTPSVPFDRLIMYRDALRDAIRARLDESKDPEKKDSPEKTGERHAAQ